MSYESVKNAERYSIMYRFRFLRSVILCRAVLLFILSGLMGAVSGANVYWVSTTGNDGNDGSESAPFASISYALTVIEDLDTVRILQGEYYEQVLIQDLSGITDFVLEGIGDSVKVLSPRSGPVMLINYPFSQNTVIRNLYITHQFSDSSGPGLEIEGTALTV